MHPCLCISEILAMIFEEVDRTGSNRELCALMTTCKTFSRYAVAILWRTLPNPMPLLLAMPNDLWELEKFIQYVPDAVIQSKSLTFKRDVVSEDWRMFDFYAQFVTELGSIPGYKIISPIITSVTISERICYELKRRDRVLLPNLKTMIATAYQSGDSSLFLASPIQHFTLQMNANNNKFTNLCRLVDDVSLHLPHLKSFHLVKPSGWLYVTQNRFAAILPRLLNGLRLLQDLEEFFCDWLGPLSNDIIISLLQMANLRKMTVHKEIAAMEQILLDHMDNPHLEEVAIWTNYLGVHSLAGLLISLRPALLTSFHVSTIFGSCFQADLDSFLNAIGKHCSPARFTELVVDSFYPPSPIVVTAVNFSMLGPLLSFSHLRVLTLGHHPFDMTDEEIKKIAIAWPNLTKLKYEVTVTTPEPRTTMRGLLWLATFCRKLEFLSFKLNRMCEVSPDELALAANHGLNVLDVGESRFNSPKMKAFLKVVFPTLARVGDYSDH